MAATKNTILKNVSACGIPATNGNIANTIGTAPLNPTHDTSACSLNGTLNGNKHIKVAIGRPTNIINTDINNASPRTGNKSGKLTNKPIRIKIAT